MAPSPSRYSKVSKWIANRGRTWRTAECDGSLVMRSWTVDEALAGHCTEINVVVLSDDRISVEDNGRGIPV